MKQRAYIFFFLLLLAGYCCQVSRFYVAATKYSSNKTCEKFLTKRIAAVKSNFKIISVQKSTQAPKKYNKIKDTGCCCFNNCRLSSFHSYTCHSLFTPIISAAGFSTSLRGPPSIC